MKLANRFKSFLVQVFN